ncbi:DUF2437 domain-containing protein [Sneathiella glossodoripedis]|uniref:DUF2437 domain-containing protein n=1 Tax=Sneathiella glossodoripedis TaxID=418853 RepID=UPI0019025009|nr:DUF2437 domain-containing protein [Sneathiella glossodoripedis]
MRFVRFRKGDETVHGLVEGLKIYELQGSIFSGAEQTGAVFDLDEVELDIPVVPRTFYAAGLNYKTHLEKMSVAVGMDASAPGAPDIGYRANNALIAHECPIIILRMQLIRFIMKVNL